MSTRSYVLNAAQPVMPVDLDFPAVAVAIQNPTSSPVYLRIGAPDTPTETNADVVIPAATALTLPVQGYSFALALGDTSLIVQAGSASLSGLFSNCEVKFLGAGELIPAYGEYSFLSLSIADLTPTPLTFAHPNTTSPTFDLLPWGGAVVYALPSSGTGQGVVSVQASADQSTWFNVVRLAFWPNVPLTINVPKVARYMRLVFNATAIVGEPNIGGLYTVRASLSEINQVTYSSASGTISYGFNVPSLGSQSFYFNTTGLKGVAIRAVFSSGSRAQLIWYTAPSLGNWGLVAYREQSVAGFYNSIFRSIGNLDSFLRVDILDIAGGGVNGTITLTVQEAPDLTGMLQNLHSDLGDIGQPVNANQSIFHVLDTSRLSLASIQSSNTAIQGSVSSIDSKLSTLLSQAQSYTEYFFTGATITTGGTYVTSGPNLNGYGNRYITAASIAYQVQGQRRLPGVILAGLGTAGGINQYLYRVRETTQQAQGVMPAFDYRAGMMGTGIQILASRPNIWFYADSNNTIVELFLTIR